ncbi:ABC transporter transmembrane domain-containing protein [Microvirga sp. TS319]|uniref:ABC transporter transmembrane domain-containing protein n=1 Tax=Microvirga sp. TS319 TaxID=3241165 RepID=UPI00351AA45E
MEKSLFRYIWTHSKRDQLFICFVVLLSQPFYFISLDLPRQIVNEAIQGDAFKDGNVTAPFLRLHIDWPRWLGGGSLQLFEGFQVGRVGLLIGLSCLFLFFVVINNGFKYWINLAKGVLGERMLRRMRFDLFAMVLRFTPEALRTVKSSETATIIKDEVEPIGGFIGDAFITPVLLGLQALTALFFIMVQNVWLGLMALAVIGVQFTIIPRLRRELLHLGKQRQLASRELAGRIGEVLDGIEVVHVHNAYAWERAEIGSRLFSLFAIRLKIYNRKFAVKFLNNFLSQVTPFLFYAVGGYFALRGTLDIGQLVAVISAYRELPPPLKELIDWDQQRLDVQVKYDQVTQHFAEERLGPMIDAEEAANDEPLAGPLVAEGLSLTGSHGDLVIDNASFSLELPATVALISNGSPAASMLARILARRIPGYSGRIRIADRDLAHLPVSVTGRRIAYAGVDPIIFPGSIRDNLVYGLRIKPMDRDAERRDVTRRIAEAARTGNPFESIADRWVDYERLGLKDEHDLDRVLVGLLNQIGMGESIYLFGLVGQIDPERHAALAERLVEARNRLRENFRSNGMADLVEPFDIDRYNDQATIAENLLFGVPVSEEFVGRNLADNSRFRSAIDRAGLTDKLTEMGLQIAETMTEIFQGLPPGHSLFAQFSFIGADELPEFQAILRRLARGGSGLRQEERTRLLALPLAYIEARHRLGLLDDELRRRIVEARSFVRDTLEKEDATGVEFYDPDGICMAAPLRDNLLFGRVNYQVADARHRVAEAIAAVVRELDLLEDVERIGLDHEVGAAGRLLSPQERASINLVRCLVKRPDILVIDGALAPFDEERAERILRALLDYLEQQSLFMVLSNDRQAAAFDVQMRFHGDTIVTEKTADSPGRAQRPEVESARNVAGEVA